MRVAYVGHEALTFTDYIDLEAGKTLHAVPGGTYDIAPASGRNVPEVPEPSFVAADPVPAAEVRPAEPDATPEPEPAPEPAPEPDELEPAPEPAQF